jgi:hypothetical protein
MHRAVSTAVRTSRKGCSVALFEFLEKGVIELADAGAFAVSNTPLVTGMLGYDASLEDLPRVCVRCSRHGRQASGAVNHSR